jgi:hypothetical protein
VITNKTCSSNKPFIVTWGGSWAIIWVNSVNGGVYSKWTCYWEGPWF